jgi:acetyl esterase/lipase
MVPRLLACALLALQAVPFAPQPIVTGGIVIPLYAPDSPYLKKERLAEPEVLNMQASIPGRIQSIVNIHNPSIEIHPVDRGINTGAVVILIPGGGHNTLNVGTEGADFVHFFYNYGVNTAILRNRLRKDGYVAEVDAVRDAQQAIRVVRAHASEYGIDPRRIGVVGFSAGAELAAPAAIAYDAPEARPDFVGLIYPGPTPFTRSENGDSARRAADVHRVCRLRRRAARAVGRRLLPRVSRRARPQPRDAHLRQRRPCQRHEGS